MLSTIIVLIILCTIIGLIIYGLYKDHKKGIGICGGDCSQCGSACTTSNKTTS